MRVEREGGAAAWLVGTLAVPRVQGHGLPRPDTLGSLEGNTEGPGTASSEPLLPS